MRHVAPFQPGDLAALDERLFCAATQIVPMRDIANGQDDANVIGLRHDIDNVIEPAVAFAEWEAARGYRSTYYVLHTAPYWQDEPLLRRSLERIADCGHEIGIHNNALTEALVTGRDPRGILAKAIEQLRGYGFDIRGTVAHGDPLCYGADGKVRVVNDEMFSECARPQLGDPRRTVETLTLEPVPLGDFGLEYDANWLSRGAYLSDSGGRWSEPGFDAVADGFPYAGQLHMLVHPDWWHEAFVAQEVAA